MTRHCPATPFQLVISKVVPRTCWLTPEALVPVPSSTPSPAPSLGEGGKLYSRRRVTVQARGYPSAYSIEVDFSFPSAVPSARRVRHTNTLLHPESSGPRRPFNTEQPVARRGLGFHVLVCLLVGAAVNFITFTSNGLCKQHSPEENPPPTLRSVQACREEAERLSLHLMASCHRCSRLGTCSPKNAYHYLLWRQRKCKGRGTFYSSLVSFPS